MEKRELEIIRSKYKMLVERNQRILKLQEILGDLERCDTVKKYNEIKQILNNETMIDENRMFSMIFDAYTRDKIECDIYVYDGSYTYDRSYDARSDYRCYNLDSADYVLYKHLINSFDQHHIKPELCKTFESNRIIVRFNSYYSGECNYYELQKFYFKSLLEGYNEDNILEMIEEKKKEFGIKSIDKCKKVSSKVKILGKGDIYE